MSRATRTAAAAGRWPGDVFKNLPGRPPSGIPARCASNIHADRQAVAWGTFTSPKGEVTTNVGYCGDCARVLHLVGWFQPNNINDIPGEE